MKLLIKIASFILFIFGSMMLITTLIIGDLANTIHPLSPYLILLSQASMAYVGGHGMEWW